MSFSCPCNLKSAHCVCNDLITGSLVAETPLDLMRSRYVAFATGECEYLFETSSQKLKAELSVKELRTACQNCDFTNLEIINAENDTVEFKADFIADGYLQQIYEKSIFIKENGEWKYDSGELFDVPIIKIERNDKCPCGSNQKFKKCHGK